jgi:hypothetical protein
MEHVMWAEGINTESGKTDNLSKENRAQNELQEDVNYCGSKRLTV